MTRTVYRERIPHSDPRLRRHILHDSESWRYPFDTTGITIASVEHERILPILNQRKIGKCTAEAALGILGTAPYWSADLMSAYAKVFGSADDNGTNQFYSAEEQLDGHGSFPPVDDGSSGLTSAKVARTAGLISGWTQTFTLDDFLKALQKYPISCGTYWYNSMFTCPSSGILDVTSGSGIAGGHQYEAVGYDSTTGLIWFDQSWGTWGLDGRFAIPDVTFGALLARKGDATIFTPVTQPAPVPTPTPVVPTAADVKLNAELGGWPDAYHLGTSNARVAHLLQTWRTESGF